MQTVRDRVSPRDLPDWLLSRGRPTVTNAEIAELLGASPHEASRVAGRWHAKALAFSPTRGLQVLIPPEFRTWGALPADQFIDPMMHHLGHCYYVGYLSAAEIHGAAHQRPQVFQVVTDARVRDKQFGRVRATFYVSSTASHRPTLTVNTPTGTLTVGSVPTTVLDLAARPVLGGGTSNVATVIGDLIDTNKLDSNAVAELADQYPAAVIRRAGWLIDFMARQLDATIDLEPLQSKVDHSIEPTPLIASDPASGRLDARWNVYINGEIEPDL